MNWLYVTPTRGMREALLYEDTVIMGNSKFAFLK